MKIFVETYNLIEGMHHWSEAKGEVEYLSNPHRHLFEIRCRFEVSHNDREIEINTAQNDIERYLKERFSRGGGICLFGGRSCEDIAEEIMTHFGEQCVQCTVLEDGYGGATLSR